METGATHQQSSYSIISYPGAELPETYRRLVFSKWLRSLRLGNDYFKLIDNDAYFQAYSKYITILLASPTTIVKLAVLSDDHDVVLSFAVLRDNILDYVHTQKDQRNLGIAKSLIVKNVDTITHLTKIGLGIWSKYPNVKFNPFA